MKISIDSIIRCKKCGKPIAHVLKIDTGMEYQYKAENLDNRYIDKWGFERNFCKLCMK